MNSQTRPAPPDQLQRLQALDPTRSPLVQAPAGSGKTDLLTRRFLRLLAEVQEPGQIVAITFTKAAAAEMRHRILSELEKAVDSQPVSDDEFAMDKLAHRALARSRALGWDLLDLPSQLRITTIDAFCRELAIQQPLLSGLGGGLDIADQPAELYRRAARHSLQQIDQSGDPLADAIQSLLIWRDNGWKEMEDLLVVMLSQRDRWMHDFVLDREPDWDALRDRLERPFAHAVAAALLPLDALLRLMPSAFEEALALARFACESVDTHRDLAERPQFPSPPFATSEEIEDARQAYGHLAKLLLTEDGAFRKSIDKRLGFPADRKHEKQRLLDLIAGLRSIEGLETALAVVRDLPPARYTEDDWQIVRACFTLLRSAAAELQVAFAEAGQVDFIEIAQIALRVLRDSDGLPTDAALAIGDKIRHLLVDEFQDTSRRQHQLLASLIAAWPERPGRTCFAVGDPMQSIYFFRDADAELFPRVRDLGLEVPNLPGLDADPLLFDFVPLQANFRTAPALVNRLNELFQSVFAANDGSGVTFASALPARAASPQARPGFELHLVFIPQPIVPRAFDLDAQRQKEEALASREAADEAQLDAIVSLIQSHWPRIEEAQHACQRGEDARFRIAILGRARSALAPIAQKLRAAQIPFRAVDLEKLAARPEVLDALALARAILNPQDRVAWLGVLRAPWCGLSLADLHALTSCDDPATLSRPIPDLLAERLPIADEFKLSNAGRTAASRVLHAFHSASQSRALQPTASLGTWLEQVWLSLGGAACVDASARANLDLLWDCLDRLPGGEADLLGPALATALEKLTALPDPTADPTCGVQLMTIHKSKGLEFEVVIVPELQARGGAYSGKLLSWLERGLPEPDASGAITEFLVAPLQPKGADRGRAKAWVDRVYRQRETQEMRRILYVAATRAREELHFFAKPAYKTSADGDLALAAPTASLLATAWPALEAEVFARFEQWKAARPDAADETLVESIAAQSQSSLAQPDLPHSNLLVMPAPPSPTLLRRLPLDYNVAHLSPPRDRDVEIAKSASDDPRHEGGLLSRALGTAVHALLEEFARLRASLQPEPACAALRLFEPTVAARVRATGVSPAEATRIAAQAVQQALSAAQDPTGAWILSPHTDAASEVAWTGLVGADLRAVRIDRLFKAGATPNAAGENFWWIIDYKTAHADTEADATALAKLRPLFAPQLAGYAAVLRGIHGPDAQIRAGLYYPRMLLFDWWEL
jgi:ATP-dependent exoDNAse (exonuclease V) beta subunit